MRNYTGIVDNKQDDILSKLIGYVFIVLAGLILFAKCIYMFDIFPVPLSIIGILFTVAILILLFKYFDILIYKIKNLIDILNNCSYIKLLLLVITISLVTKIACIFIFDIVSIYDNSDINVYTTTSYELSHYGQAITHADYCARATHLFWYAVFLTPSSSLFGMSQIAFSVYISIISTISIALLFDTVSFVFSKKKAFVFSIIYVLIPSQVILTQFITHEHAIMLFLSIAIWLYFRVMPVVRNIYLKIILFLIIIANVVFCRLVNPGGRIVVIAFIIIFIISALRNIKKRTIFKCVFSCLALIIALTVLSSCANNFQLSHSKISGNPEKGSILWTFYIGSNYETSGSYSFEDADIWFEQQPKDKQIADKYHKDLLFNRYSDLIKNPIKLLDLCKNKLKNMWANFNYSTGSATEKINNKQTRDFYTSYLYKPSLLINYLIMLLVGVICLYSSIVNRKKRKPLFYCFVQLYLLGFSAMLMLSELQQRYTITMLPLYLIAAIAVLDFKKQDNN